MSWQLQIIARAHLCHVALVLAMASLQAHDGHYQMLHAGPGAPPCCLGGIPRQVLVASGPDPVADVERALVNLKWDDLVSGFTPDSVGFPDSASHRLLLISALNWISGEHCSLVVNSLLLQGVQSHTPAHQCRAGDFTTWDITFRSNEICRRLAEQMMRRFGEQQRAFLSASDDQPLSESLAF